MTAFQDLGTIGSLLVDVEGNFTTVVRLDEDESRRGS